MAESERESAASPVLGYGYPIGSPGRVSSRAYEQIVQDMRDLAPKADASLPKELPTVDPLGRRIKIGGPLIAPETGLSGGRTNYYLVWVDHPQREDQAPYRAECEDIIHALGLTFDEGNIFKEIWRTANARKGNGKPGQDDLRAGQKIVHYAKRLLRATEIAMDPSKPKR